ncbi:MAG: tetratricopeptide repeat protein [Candidatus Jordarchaeum sp.]|uniref:tetratricopeptide repeat protein n=1 Tax=Candidatus Jordarchaeum sp. TaxID=2823881 RepID=UPI004049D796
MSSSKAGLEESAAKILFLSGVKLLSQGEGERALRRFEKASEIFTEKGLKSEMARCYRQMGNVYTFYEEWDKAETCYKNAIELDRKLKDWPNLLENLFLLTNLLMDKNELNGALEYAQEAEKVSRKAKDKVKQFQSYKQIGQIYERLWNLKKALEYFEKAIKIGDKIDHPEIASLAREVAWILKKEVDAELRRRNSKIKELPLD